MIVGIEILWGEGWIFLFGFALHYQQEWDATSEVKSIQLSEQHLYGSSRLGILGSGRYLAVDAPVSGQFFGTVTDLPAWYDPFLPPPGDPCGCGPCSTPPCAPCWCVDIDPGCSGPPCGSQSGGPAATGCPYCYGDGWPALPIEEADHILGSYTRGKKRYELSNHLGNVLAVISDRKLQIDDGNGTVVSYNPDIWAYNDYYPFGMTMMERTWQAADYRYGFQGQETDDEIFGEGNAVNYTFRMYDARIGRFLSIDPLAVKYPWNSPYAFSENRVIDAVDSEGMYIFLVIGGEVYRFTEDMIRNTRSDNVLQKAMALAWQIPSQENRVGFDNPIRKYLNDRSHDIYFVVAHTNDNHHGALPNASVFNKGRDGSYEFDQEAFLAYMQEKNPEATFDESRLANFETLNGTDVSRSEGQRHYSMVYLSDQQFGEDPSGLATYLGGEVDEKTAPYDGALIIIHETGNHIDERNNTRNPGGVHNTDSPSDWEIFDADTYFKAFIKKHLPTQQKDDE